MTGASRKWLMFGAVAGVFTLGAAVIGGVALAQTGGGSGGSTGAAASPTPNARKAQVDDRVNTFLNDLATNLHIDRTTLDGALKTTANQEIDAAVKSGKLTQAEGDMAKQAIASGKFPTGFGGGIGRAAIKGDIAALQGCMTGAQQAVQSLTGETAAQLKADLKSGKTLASILQAMGKTEQNLRDAVVTAVQPCLDTAVKAGTLTAAQQQQIIAEMQSGKGFGLPGIFGGPREHGGPGGHNRPNRGATPAAGGTQ